jgi:creatinine amidohydrolase
MIDATDTTVDWQVHPGVVAILPVGSVEQHAAHLPLNTDCVAADYFARALAEDLGAALLPGLPYGNCLEHSGFRGSVTLRPETLMQVIRDLADAVEQQGFRILVVVNGHGGNFALAPVIRDINRADRPLKILLVPFWECGDPKLATDSAPLYRELHAGEWETSLMLAIQPDLVRSDLFKDMPVPAPSAVPLQQHDLNWCGVGHFTPDGAIGAPTFSTREKGLAIAASLRAGILAYVRDRIGRIGRDPRYAGAAGLSIRRLCGTDLQAAMRLKTLARWNQVREDWELCLRMNPDGCLGLFQNGNLLGTAVVVRYAPSTAWIGMVLVDPELRRMGLGTRLMDAALAHAGDGGGVLLDAAPAGRPLYARLGFCELGSVLRLTGVARIASRSGDARPLDPEGLAAMIHADKAIAGCDRSALLEDLYARAPGQAFGIRRGNEWVAFCLGRAGTDFRQIGPVIAATEADAIAVISASLQSGDVMPVMLDVPSSHRAILDFLAQAGLTVQRGFTRMVRGDVPTARITDGWFACAGPEFG